MCCDLFLLTSTSRRLEMVSREILSAHSRIEKIAKSSRRREVVLASKVVSIKKYRERSGSSDAEGDSRKGKEEDTEAEFCRSESRRISMSLIVDEALTMTERYSSEGMLGVEMILEEKEVDQRERKRRFLRLRRRRTILSYAYKPPGS